jgi:pyridoxal biosynthesis lyase PdxS
MTRRSPHLEVSLSCDAACAALGVARMSDPEMIQAIKAAVTIPVMAKARIGHFVEAQILQAIEIDFIDESEVCNNKNR